MPVAFWKNPQKSWQMQAINVQRDSRAILNGNLLMILSKEVGKVRKILYLLTFKKARLCKNVLLYFSFLYTMMNLSVKLIAEILFIFNLKLVMSQSGNTC